MSECHYGSGDVIYESDLKELLSKDCVIEPGARIILYYGEDVAAEDLGSGVVTTKPKKRHKMNEAEASGGDQPLLPPNPAPLIADLTAAPIATTEQPSLDVAALTQLTGGNGGIAVALALIAVLFGAAGWKFWTKISEQNHELKMKQLEMQASAGNGNSPQQCAAVHAQHEARLAALETKVGAVEKSALSLDADFDPEDLKKRLAKLEKLLKAKPKA